MLFSTVHPACHNILNGIKPGSYSKHLISMLPSAKKLYVGALCDLCEVKKLFIQNITKDIRLLDKIAMFACTG